MISGSLIFHTFVYIFTNHHPKELAEGIRADADRQETVIEANAYRESQLIRGDGDAIAAATYAAAFNQDHDGPMPLGIL